MREKLLISFLILAALFCAFYLGYTIGNTNKIASTESAGNQALYSSWVEEEQPPFPEISIDGVKIELVRGGYSWCMPPVGNEGQCVSTDAGRPTNLRSTIVLAGSQIDTKASQGIKEFTLLNTNKDVIEEPDDLYNPYLVPKKKGIYLYEIHCEWLLDQGQSNFYFSVEVP